MQTGSLVYFSSTGVDLVLYLLDLVSRLKQQDVEDLFMATLQVGTKFISLAMRYSKTCINIHSQKDQNWFSRLIIA